MRGARGERLDQTEEEAAIMEVKKLRDAVLEEAGLTNASEMDQIRHLTSLNSPGKSLELTDTEKAYLEAAAKAPKREYQQKGRI